MNQRRFEEVHVLKPSGSAASILTIHPQLFQPGEPVHHPLLDSLKLIRFLRPRVGPLPHRLRVQSGSERQNSQRHPPASGLGSIFELHLTIRASRRLVTDRTVASALLRGVILDTGRKRRTGRKSSSFLTPWIIFLRGRSQQSSAAANGLWELF